MVGGLWKKEREGEGGRRGEGRGDDGTVLGISE